MIDASTFVSVSMANFVLELLTICSCLIGLHTWYIVVLWYGGS